MSALKRVPTTPEILFRAESLFDDASAFFRQAPTEDAYRVLYNIMGILQRAHGSETKELRQYVRNQLDDCEKALASARARREGRSA